MNFGKLKLLKRDHCLIGGYRYTFYGNKILNVQEGNDFILKSLLEHSPILIGRIGT